MSNKLEIFWLQYAQFIGPIIFPNFYKFNCIFLNKQFLIKVKKLQMKREKPMKIVEKLASMACYAVLKAQRLLGTANIIYNSQLL